MPRVINEEILGAGWGVEWEERAEVDPEDGQLIHHRNGDPKTVRVAVLVFKETLPGEIRLLRIPLDDRARRGLVEQLTGGIAIPDLKLQT